MTYTEENIVYQILNQFKGSRINDDNDLGEREIRALMHAKRAAIIQKQYMTWKQSDQSEFQNLGLFDLTPVGSLYTCVLPRIITLEHNQGIKLFIASGYQVMIMTKETFGYNSRGPINSHLPKAYIEKDILYLSLGNANTYSMEDGSAIQGIIDNVVTTPKIEIDAILYDPSDQVGYDWTSSPFPLSASLITMLKDEILLSDFRLSMQAKEDEVANMKSDSIRYHDQGKID